MIKEYQPGYQKEDNKKHVQNCEDSSEVFTFIAVQQRHALALTIALVQITRRSEVGRYARSFGRFQQIRTDEVVAIHDQSLNRAVQTVRQIRLYVRISEIVHSSDIKRFVEV